MTRTNLAGFSAQHVQLCANTYPIQKLASPSQGCGSSPAKQLEYFQELLSAVQDRRRQIPLVNLVWLHDIPAAELAGYRGYYGVSSPCFESYLGTLGLRNLDGTNKPSYEWLTSR